MYVGTGRLRFRVYSFRICARGSGVESEKMNLFEAQCKQENFSFSHQAFRAFDGGKKPLLKLMEIC